MFSINFINLIHCTSIEIGATTIPTTSTTTTTTTTTKKPKVTPTTATPTTTRKKTSTTPTTTEAPCIPSVTIVKNRGPLCKNELIFEDTFSSLNRSKWENEIRISGDMEDAEFVSFQNRNENYFVQDGKLNIIPTLLTDLPEYDEDLVRTGELNLNG